MVSTPPHLPYPSCEVKTHRRWLWLKTVAAAAGFSLFAGFCGALMAVGWVWPDYGGGETLIVSKYAGLSRPPLEDVAFKEMKEKVFSVYGEGSALGGVNYFNPNKFIAEAAAVGSDGWLVAAPVDARQAAAYKKWRVLSGVGDVYKVEQIIFDPYVRLAYLKVAPLAAAQPPAQLKVTAFGDEPAAGDDIYVYENDSWRSGRVEERRDGFLNETRLDSAVNHVYILDRSFKTGSIAVNGRGRMVGFIVAENYLLPTATFTNLLPRILSEQKLAYPSLGVAGWFSTEQPLAGADGRLDGFAVSQVWSKNSLLRRGDVILEINGQVASNESLWYNLGGDKARLKILRAGSVKEIETPVLTADAASL